MTGPPAEWPTVDVFIPSYNETLDIVKLTIFAAQAIDWPQDKLRVHVLDDGRREDFREFCEQVGVNYIVRDNNRHAKAGNMNEALKVTSGEFVAIFDADHMPTRSFLQIASAGSSRIRSWRCCRRRTSSSRRTPSRKTWIPSVPCPTKASCSTVWSRTATTCGTRRSSAAPAR